MIRLALLLLATLPGAPPAESAPGDAKGCFTIRVLDDRTGRGVPLVELRTTNQVRWYTDSNGIVAIRDPGMMGQSVFFHVQSHGYEYPKDQFGYCGQMLQVSAGGRAQMKIKRLNLAERLYRVTGADIYGDSVQAGVPVPIRQPLLNAKVYGSDSVQETVYRSRIYWFWGDTSRPAYPLGNFHVPGATSVLPGQGGLDPEIGVDLTYLTDDQGFARPTCKMPGDGPTWIDGLVVLRDTAGSERLFAAYQKIRPPFTLHARGLAEFDDKAQEFHKIADLSMNAPNLPGGNPFHHKVNGQDYVYFARPLPLTRVGAKPDELKDLVRYESFTCLKEGSRLDHPQVERTPDGRPLYGWKRNTPAVGQKEQEQLTRSGQLRPHEGLIYLRDRDAGKTVQAHGGSVYWNAYRRRWVLITVQFGGTTLLGEVWYAEADTPVGPWVYAVKVVTHDNYSFYNPKQHPMFDKQGGRLIFFEGTYANTFSSNTDPTPRYDYNQMMYKLDLADPGLALPGPVYQEGKRPGPLGLTTKAPPGIKEGQWPFAFFALDRPAPGMVPILPGPDGAGTLVVGKAPTPAAPVGQEPLFYALPADAAKPPATTVALEEWVGSQGNDRVYVPDSDPAPKGFRRAAKPLCRVWRDPYKPPRDGK
jgi:hypothetical protein